MPGRTSFENYVEENSERFINGLIELVAQPSVSAQNHGVTGCTELLESLCSSMGFDETSVVDTPGQPSIIAHAYADHDEGNDAPTVLLYGHYDVQPVDPEAWTSPPFEPDIREGPTGEDHLYARGVSDMKAQLFAHLCAVEAHRETGGLPMNVTLFLEGEEEVGSPNIEWVVRRHEEQLQADVMYHPDGEMWEAGQPHLLLGDRGLVLGQIDLTAANRDLHSGHFGGVVPNAARELVRICESMMADDGTISVDGVNDDVREVTDRGRALLDAITFDTHVLEERLGVDELLTRGGASFPETIMFQPQLNFSGFTAGYGGTGNKNIVPSKAQAKFDVRLVPEQDPDRVFRHIARHVDEHAPPLVDVELTRLESDERKNRASGTPPDSVYVEQVERAVQRVWGVDPNVFQRSGASGPIDVFERHLDVPHVSAPNGSPGSRRHGPDENMALSYFLKGIQTSGHVIQNFSETATGAVR